ncbi:MAG: energy transducer TonB [Pseudomonadales bacterium]|nr:energy transducer TonB [Pseudomonadales bacterium]MDP6470701.1 energy transducer TonB [Pseudomonadales bacterium]MDP6828347.1 energy transducer TonB [Pseudomonadales bacterium]MDP6972103.1 energy transducer TonB [Pseudomonadales bacterium]
MENQWTRVAKLAVVLAVLGGCVGSSNRPMQLLDAVGPVYPEDARTAGVEGSVVVRYDLSNRGEVRNLWVVHSEPPGVFDEAALAAVARWRYRPPTLDGVPQKVRNIESTVTFALKVADPYDGL